MATAGSWWRRILVVAAKSILVAQPEKTRCTTSRPAATSPMAVTHFFVNSLSTTCQYALEGDER